MITDLFFAALLGIVNVIFILPMSLLPDATLPANLQDAITNIDGIMSTVNPIFPLDTLLTVLGIVISVEVAIFTYKALYWLIKKIPGIS